MAAEIIGIDRIDKYSQKYEYKKIKLMNGNNIVYQRRLRDGESQDDLFADFREFVDENILPNNFRDYKFELMGSRNPEPDAKLNTIVKTIVAFNERPSLASNLGNSQNTGSNSISLQSHIALVEENAKLRSEIVLLENQIDELLAASEEEEEKEEIGSTPETIGQAVNQSLMGKIPQLIDIGLAMLANMAMKGQPAQTTALNGIPETDALLEEFRKINPSIDEDLKKLYVLAQTQPDFFNMMLNQLRTMVK